MNTLETNAMTHSSTITKLTLSILGALAIFACSNNDDDRNTALATGTASSTSGAPGGACSGTAPTCSNATLSACEDGVTKTASCQDQCVADGFKTGSACTKDGTRCGCETTTDTACTDGINAFCTCLDSSPACQGYALLDNYTRCHRDPSSETATILKCFASHKSGDQIACNTAITGCGSPSNGCTADADCGHCERCERSTGKCLTRVACN